MRLIELKEKVNRIAIPRSIVDDLMATEIDTISDDSPSGKHALADDFQRAEYSKGGAKVPLSDESMQYLVQKSIPNMIDIAKDNLDKRKTNSLQKLQARLHAKLTK